jgi:NIPSNAP
MEERERVMREVAKLPGWPPEIRQLLIEEDVGFFESLPFSPPVTPRTLGNIYEFRTYTYGVGFMPEVIERWGEKIPERQKMSPFVGAWQTTSGRLSRLRHIWAYDDAARRQVIRAKAIATGAWPPNTHAEGMLLKQENILAVPASISPLR